MRCLQPERGCKELRVLRNVPCSQRWSHIQSYQSDDFFFLKSCVASGVPDAQVVHLYLCLSLFLVYGTFCLLIRRQRQKICLRRNTELTHTLIITLYYTRCYDEIKGSQDLKICSHADSLMLYLSFSAICLSCFLCLSLFLRLSLSICVCVFLSFWEADGGACGYQP